MGKNSVFLVRHILLPEVPKKRAHAPYTCSPGWVNIYDLVPLDTLLEKFWADFAVCD